LLTLKGVILAHLGAFQRASEQWRLIGFSVLQTLDFKGFIAEMPGTGIEPALLAEPDPKSGKTPIFPLFSVMLTPCLH
jgi:hypothetical protein